MCLTIGFIFPLLHFSLKPRTSHFWWVANPLLTIHRFAAPSCFFQSITSKAAIIALFGPNRYRHPQFPGFLVARLSADYWWPIRTGRPPKLRQIMSSTVFCSSSPRDRWRGVQDNLHQKYQLQPIVRRSPHQNSPPSLFDCNILSERWWTIFSSCAIEAINFSHCFSF